MPVWLRRFYIKKIEEFKKQEADAHKQASDNNTVHQMGGGR